jgi:hypothetical protein
MNVTFDITRAGGQLGPVHFRIGRHTVQPFSTAPWCDKPEARKLIPLLRELRGDFFCAPFGAGPAWGTEAHPPHGESANATWTVHPAESGRLVATLNTKVRAGKITKVIETREGETNLYQTHELEGLQGGMSLGHHAMLDFTRNGPGRISTSRIRLAQVVPEPFEIPRAATPASRRAPGSGVSTWCRWLREETPTSVAILRGKASRISL